MLPLLWFTLDSTFLELFGRRPRNSIQREAPLLTMSPKYKILEKQSESGSDVKTFLFTYLQESIRLTNESFLNFAHEFIIDHQIVPNDKKTHTWQGKSLFFCS